MKTLQLVLRSFLDSSLSSTRQTGELWEAFWEISLGLVSALGEMVLAWLNALGYVVKMEMDIPGMAGNFEESVAILGFPNGVD